MWEIPTLLRGDVYSQNIGSVVIAAREGQSFFRTAQSRLSKDVRKDVLDTLDGALKTIALGVFQFDFLGQEHSTNRHLCPSTSLWRVPINVGKISDQIHIPAHIRLAENFSRVAKNSDTWYLSILAIYGLENYVRGFTNFLQAEYPEQITHVAPEDQAETERNIIAIAQIAYSASVKRVDHLIEPLSQFLRPIYL